MQQYQDSVTHANGTPVAGASIRVLTAAGAQATIYSDNGVTVASNPIKAGANGQFAFYAADGNYTLVISAVGHVGRTVTGIILRSPSPTPDAGPTASRPIPSFAGQVYFDTDLQQPVWCNQLSPPVWVNAAGAQV